MEPPATDSNYFAQVKKTIAATLTPFHRAAQSFVNSGGTGTAARIQYAGWVGAAQTNGAGPVADPVNAPWSFDSFALGIPNFTRVPPLKSNRLVFRG
jgi:hypothetical protein